MSTEVKKKSAEARDDSKGFKHLGKLLTVCLIAGIVIITGFIIYYLYTPESPYHTYTILNEDKRMELYPTNASKGKIFRFMWDWVIILRKIFSLQFAFLKVIIQLF